MLFQLVDRYRFFCRCANANLFSMADGFGGDAQWTKHQFKIVIEPGHRECFYQPVSGQSVFVNSYQVIRGDDINYELLLPNGTAERREERSSFGSYQMSNVTNVGDYAVCFDNSYSHITSKLVSVYMLTFHEERIKAHMDEQAAADYSVTLANKLVGNISLNIIEIFTSQALSRFKQASDEHLLQANNSLVFYWSITQSVLIVAAGLFQVYFIKRLFLVSMDAKRSSSRN